MRDKKGSTAEVDFVYQTQGKIIPIEVKSGANAHLRSLQSYMKTEGAIMLGIRIWPGMFSVDDVKVQDTQSTYRLVNVPFYMVGQLDKIIERLL
jgi:predicted AAA+ superfamily ATPase